jgi:hypothetical protein
MIANKYLFYYIFDINFIIYLWFFMIKHLLSFSSILELNNFKIQEDSIRCGKNITDSSIYLSAQTYLLLDILTNIFPNFSFLNKHQKLLSALTFTPFIVAHLEKNQLIPAKIMPLTRVFREHATSFYQTALSVACVCQLFFCRSFRVLPIITGLFINALNNRGILSSELKKCYQTWLNPVIWISNLFYASFFHKIINIIEIANIFSKVFLPHSLIDQTVELPQNQIKDYSQVNELLNPATFSKVSFNPDLLKVKDKRPLQRGNSEIFLKKFNEINWTQHLDALKTKCRSDARFKDKYREENTLTDDIFINYAKTNLEACINGILNKQILHGRPTDYERLENYFLSIAHYLSIETNEICICDSILRIAIEGGQYCGPALFDVLEELSNQFSSGDQNIAIFDRIVSILADKRLRKIDEYVSKLSSINILNKIYDFNDRHTHNQFIALFSQNLGVTTAASEQDQICNDIPYFAKLFFSISSKLSFKEFYKDVFSIDNTVRGINEAFGTSYLPKPLIYQFWCDWFTKRNSSIPESLSMNAELWEQPIEIDGKINPIFIYLMLIDMSILVKKL